MGRIKEKCPKCKGELAIMRNKSEPEGIRRDRKCKNCGQRFMVTKSHYIEIQPT